MTMTHTHIMPEHGNDRLAIEALLERSFGRGRHRKTVQKMRKHYLPAEGLAFVMTDDNDNVIGTIRLWDIDAGFVPALLLGPVAIAPEYRSKGLGDALIRHALSRAASLGHQAVLLVGDAFYYERFGFSRALTLNLKLPGPVDEARFLGHELQPGSLMSASGMVGIKGKLAPKLPAKRKAA
jgi:predicted N-acetyltransferase YhbS